MAKLECISDFYRHHSDLRIGAMIKDEVIPYMRSLAVLPKDMQEKALSRVECDSTVGFFNNLASAWHQHNELAIEIDLFLARAAYWERFEIYGEALDDAIRLFERAVAIEDAKRIYTASVKEALDKAMSVARIKYHLSESEIHSVFGLWSEAPYWIYRDALHAYWVLAQRNVLVIGPDNSRPTASRLCDIFHACSRVVLQERMEEEWLKKLIHSDTVYLLQIIERWKDYLASGKMRHIQAGYISLGRPDLKAGQSLVRYDNLTELLFGANLWGVPDLFLRRMTVNTLIRIGRIDSRESVLMYSVNELKNDCMHSSSITPQRR